MQNKYLAVLLIFLAVKPLTGQSVSPQIIGATGAFYSGNNYNVAYTAGEVIVPTFSSGNFIITQGFHQPFKFKVSNDNITAPLSVKIFPNPVENNLKVQLQLPASKKCILKLYDGMGRMVYQSKMHLQAGVLQTAHIQMAGLSNGMYLLSITVAGAKGKYAYRIIKQ